MIESHLSLFKRTPNLTSLINKQDIFYIGGGNTKSRLAVYKKWKLNQLLLKSYNGGAILCRVSTDQAKSLIDYFCYFNTH